MLDLFIEEQCKTKHMRSETSSQSAATPAKYAQTHSRLLLTTNTFRQGQTIVLQPAFAPVLIRLAHIHAYATTCICLKITLRLFYVRLSDVHACFMYVYCER